MTRFIEARSRCSAVEPICRELQVAPPSYDTASRHRPLSARRVRDEALNVEAAARPQRVLQGLRRAQALAAAATRRHLRRALHGGAADAGAESLRCGCAGKSNGRPWRTRALPDRRTWWDVTSRRPPPTGSGWPTSPPSAHGRASPASRSSSGSTRAISSAGRRCARRVPTSPSTPSSRRSGCGRDYSTGSSTT